jgi:uncharacterized membrane protein
MAIIFILILGLVLRLVNLNQSLWLDEIVQAITSKGTFLNLFSELRGDFHPPLYHFLMWSWAHLFGNSGMVMRLPSVFFGVVTVWLVYKIAQLIKGGKFFPLTAALLMATAPFHIYYSQEGRMYAFAAMTTTLSFYYFLRMVREEKSNKPAYIFTTALMLYGDYYGLLGFLAQIIIALLVLRKKIAKLIPSFLIAAAFFLPCLPLLYLQLKTGSQATFSLPEWGTLVNLSIFKALPLTFVKFTIGRITIFDKKIYALVMGILFLIYGFFLAKGFRLKKKWQITKPLTVILLWLAIPVIFAWGVSVILPNYQPFRLLFVLPAFYLLLAWGVNSFSSVWAFRLGTIFILLVNLISLGVYYQNPYFHREDWRGAVGYIESQGGEQKSLALLPSYTSHWPYVYYSQEKVPLVGLAHEFKTVSEEDLQSSMITGKEKIFYIYYLADLFDPQSLIPSWLESEKFVKIKEVSFNQIRIQEWTAKEAVKE